MIVKTEPYKLPEPPGEKKKKNQTDFVILKNTLTCKWFL